MFTPIVKRTIQPVIQRFILNENTKNTLKKLKPEFGFNGLGEVVFRRTYSRDNEDWVDVVIRVIEGVMSIRKEHFHRNSLDWIDREWQKFASDMAFSLFKMEWLPPGRGLWMMGTDFTYNRGSIALNNCFHVDTSFWTDKGLVKFSDFKNGDKVNVLGRNNIHYPATVKSFGVQKLVQLAIKLYDNTIISYLTTKNHRWILKNNEIKETHELEIGDNLQNCKITDEFNPVVYKVLDTKLEEEVWCVNEPQFQEFTLKDGILTKNCAATDTKEDLVHSAEWTMDCLMNGVGVGFSTYWRGTASMPDKTDSLEYIIDDSREGWVDSLIKLLCSYIDSPKYGKNKFPIFNYSQIRLKGLPIKGFGGVSSGPEPLQKLHKRVEEYLDAFCKGKLEGKSKTWKEVDGEWKEVEIEICKKYSHTRLVADIFNAIGACVVAGNVRRSAEISLGDVNDEDFINLKNYDLNPERSEIGWMSNNSISLKPNCDFDDFNFIPDIAKRIRDNGEPGMINLHNIQKFGRYGKEMKDEATLTNPCGEISLCNFELCNLSETFPPRCENVEIFYKALEYATFYSSTVSLLPTHRPETNAVIAKNRRIGVSISGIAQWANGYVPSGWNSMNYTKMTKILRDAYKVVRTKNTELAISAGVPSSVRVTTIKPSGSISLLAGVTPGMHYPVSRFAIRRMRIGLNSPLVPILQEAGIPNEKDTYSDNTQVFEFTIDHGEVRPCEKVSPWEQFSLLAMLQRCYSDNSVSCTIYFDKEKDAADIEKLLAMYIPVLKSVSMLPHSGHGYTQAPYEPIDEETYKKRLSEYTNPDFSKLENNVPVGSKFCSGDICEL